MRELVARFGKAVKGVLTGFDRIVFKGTILPLAHEDGAWPPNASSRPQHYLTRAPLISASIVASI